MSGELAFVEFGVEDVEKGRVFYEGLFGWKFEQGPSGQGYVISLPNVGGGIHGQDQGAAPYLFFRVDDIDAAVEKVQELGGTVDDTDVEGRRGIDCDASVGSSCARTTRGRHSVCTNRQCRCSHILRRYCPPTA